MVDARFPSRRRNHQTGDRAQAASGYGQDPGEHHGVRSLHGGPKKGEHDRVHQVSSRAKGTPSSLQNWRVGKKGVIPYRWREQTSEHDCRRAMGPGQTRAYCRNTMPTDTHERMAPAFQCGCWGRPDPHQSHSLRTACGSDLLADCGVRGIPRPSLERLGQPGRQCSGPQQHGDPPAIALPEAPGQAP